MGVYIKGMGNISPQRTWDGATLLSEPMLYNGDRLMCHEPDYTKYIDPKQLRRMSRIIKMGVAAGTMALQQASVEVPNGIITGTAYGCLEDTGIFLNKMIENSEHALNPTPFIQSTHNTIGSQIALLLQCQGYNQTYTQGAFSFENALLDALLELSDAPNQSILVGGVDEITAVSHAIQKRFGIFRDQGNNLEMFQKNNRGTMNGEGAAFFVLSGEKESRDHVRIEAVKTLYKPDNSSLKEGLLAFLRAQSLTTDDVDIIILGKSGDEKFDQVSEGILQQYFATASVAYFKHLCGEYPTASAFALWLAVRTLQENYIPEPIVLRNTNRPLNRLLLYNSYFGTHHSFILLQKC
jgi:3-oxoacyl-[acyl-carrier-protein] synthase II